MTRRKELLQMYKEMDIPKGILQIRNTVNGKLFIDSTSNMQGAFNKHRSMLDWGSHINKELQQDWKEYGPDAFAFEVLELIRPEDETNPYLAHDYMRKLERQWLDRLQPYGDRGYHRPKPIRN